VKRQWLQLARVDDLYYLNGDVYTDLDEPLRLARKHLQRVNKPMCIWIRHVTRTDPPYRVMLLSTYKTSDQWREVVTEKMSIDEIWPVFESYARML
jgi:hypothetical protein